MPATVYMPERPNDCVPASSGDAAYQEKVLRLSPLLFLPIQENNAQFTVHDVSGRERHAQIFCDSTLNTHNGPFAGTSAVDFDGTVDAGFIKWKQDNSLGPLMNGSRVSWTQEIWFSCTDQPTDATLSDMTWNYTFSGPVVARYENTLTVTAGGSLRYRLADFSGNGDTVDITSIANNVDDDIWHHVAIVRENTARGDGADQISMYYDGVLQGSATYSTDSDSVPGFFGTDVYPDWFFGGKTRDSDAGFGGAQIVDTDLYDGQIAYVAFYEEALPLATIQNHAAHT